MFVALAIWLTLDGRLRPRLPPLLMERHMAQPALPRQALATVNHEGEQDARHRVHDMRQTDLMVLSTSTPHGRVEKQITMQTHTGENVNITYTDPRASAWLLMQSCPAFAMFLLEHLRDGVSRVCVYHDDVRPGNVHRPDTARLYMGFYWLVIDLPEWWNHSLYGWWDLAFVPVKVIETLKGGWPPCSTG